MHNASIATRLVLLFGCNPIDIGHIFLSVWKTVIIDESADMESIMWLSSNIDQKVHHLKTLHNPPLSGNLNNMRKILTIEPLQCTRHTFLH